LEPCFTINRRYLLAAFATLAILFAPFLPVSTLAEAPSATDTLTSWNDGAAKQAIIDFVKATTDPSSPDFVAPEARIATFDQDGTLWVEHPMYSQVALKLGELLFEMLRLGSEDLRRLLPVGGVELSQIAPNAAEARADLSV
jgi:hypothetical protein